MAIGRPTLCFLRESYFQYINYGREIPIINVNQNTLEDVLENILKNREMLYEISVKSRQYVEGYHDSKKITQKLIKYYEGLFI